MKPVLARLVGVTLILAGPLAVPAFAANELGLSKDGVHWSQSISDPLFDSSMRWVPGDSESASFYVRNHGGTTGDLTVEVIGSQAGNLLDSGDLHITAKGGGGDWAKVSEGGRHRLLTAPDIADGQVAEIKVNVAFDAQSTNPTQLRAARLRFVATLSESGPGGPGDNSGTKGDNHGGLLPGTGASDLQWIAGIGAMLVGIGIAFVSRRREKDRGSLNA